MGVCLRILSFQFSRFIHLNTRQFIMCLMYVNMNSSGYAPNFECKILVLLALSLELSRVMLRNIVITLGNNQVSPTFEFRLYYQKLVNFIIFNKLTQIFYVLLPIKWIT
jgi:hypothetical protein